MATKRKAIKCLNNDTKLEEGDSSAAGVISGAHDEYTFYVGLFRKRIQVSRRRVDHLFEYLNVILSDVVGLVLEQQMDVESCQDTLLCHLICSILNYNGESVSVLQYSKINGPTILNEPVMLKKIENRFIMYISVSLIQDYMNTKSNTNFTFDYEFAKNDIYANNLDDIFNSIISSKSNAPNKTIDDQSQEVVFKLLVAADHAVTHYLNDNFNLRSIIDHKYFSNKNFHTLHCIVNIHGITNCKYNQASAIESNSGDLSNFTVFNDLDDDLTFNFVNTQEAFENEIDSGSVDIFDLFD